MPIKWRAMLSKREQWWSFRWYYYYYNWEKWSYYWIKWVMVTKNVLLITHFPFVNIPDLNNKKQWHWNAMWLIYVTVKCKQGKLITDLRSLKRKVHPNDSFFSWYSIALRGFWREADWLLAFYDTKPSKEKEDNK